MGAVESPAVSFSTERLLLRPLTEDDLDDVHALQSDPEVIRYVPWQQRTREESLQWLRRRIAAHRLAGDGDAVAWAVQHQETGRLIGSVNAWWRSVEHRQGEVGFILARSMQGQGLAAEATRGLIDLLFRELELHRITGVTDARNGASAALMRRLGMRQEAHFRQHELFKGEWSDSLVFAVLRSEWDAAR